MEQKDKPKTIDNRPSQSVLPPVSEVKPPKKEPEIKIPTSIPTSSCRD